MSWTSALLSPPKLREVGSLSLLLLCSYLAWSQYRQRRELQLELAKQRREAERQTKLRDEERKGRIRAEKELRQSPAATSVTATTAEGVVQGSEATESFEFHPIGSFQSCYRQRCGTPRQSNLVKSSLAVLRCVKDLNPEAALEGLAEFSHVWVLYVFHENTNTLRQPKSLARRVQQQGRVPLWQGLCMKVAPPRCPELRVGVLACRTPHRPNPVGLSLAKVVEVKASEGLVVLSGLDVIDGTPCLDLKPYLPSFESLPDSSVPQWVQSSYDEPMMEVSWSPMAAQQLALLLDLESLTLEPFASGDELKQAIEETLALDIRSPLQKQRHPNPGGDVSKPFFTGDLWFHQLHLKYSLLPLPSESAGSAACAAAVRLESLQ